jgi:hydroxyacylglutathione hydrolase
LGAVPISVLDYERKFNPAFREALHTGEDEFVKSILAGQPEPPRYFARMKRDNKIGPALLTGGKLPTPARITATELDSWIGGNDRAILDLREDRADFAAGHLEASLFAPISAGRLPIAAGSYLDESTRILLVMENESQVGEAVRQLVRIGLDHVEAWIPAAEARTRFTASYRRIAPSELPENVTVLDVRGADEHAASHVKGATNIAYTRLAARRDELPDGAPLYVHCAGGMRAAIASAYLASLGREVVQLDGAFSEIPAKLKS